MKSIQATAHWRASLRRFAPGLDALLGYERADLRRDIGADIGLFVAAVSIPIGIAYAQLAGGWLLPSLVGVTHIPVPALDRNASDLHGKTQNAAGNRLGAEQRSPLRPAVSHIRQ